MAQIIKEAVAFLLEQGFEIAREDFEVKILQTHTAVKRGETRHFRNFFVCDKYYLFVSIGCKVDK